MGVTYFSFACLSPLHTEDAFFNETLVFLLGPFGIVIASSALFVLVAPKRSNLASSFRHALRTMGVLVFYIAQPALTERAASLLSCIQLSGNQW